MKSLVSKMKEKREFSNVFVGGGLKREQRERKKREKEQLT